MSYLIGLIPALGWGVQPLILKKIKGNPANEILGTGIGAIIIGLISLMFTTGSISAKTFIISFISGLFWVIGQVGQYIAFNKIGVSKTMPLSTGLQLVGTSLIGVIFFNEWPGVSHRIIGFLVILLIIFGAILTTRGESGKPGAIKAGVILLASTSIGYWVYSAIPKVVDADGINIFLPQMLGVFVGAVIFALFKNRKVFAEKKSWQAVAVGFTFSISSLAYIFAAQRIGVASAFIITQLNVVIATLGGILILHEKKNKKELVNTLIGLALIIVGSIVTIFL